MAKLTGQDIFKTLLVALGLLFAFGYIINLVGFGDDFNIGNIGNIVGDTFLWELVVAVLVIYFAVAIIGKVEKGTLTGKTFATYVVLGIVLYFLVKFLADMGFVDIDLPFMAVASMVP